MLKWIVYAGFALCLVVGSGVSGMIDVQSQVCCDSMVDQFTADDFVRMAAVQRRKQLRQRPNVHITGSLDLSALGYAGTSLFGFGIPFGDVGLIVPQYGEARQLTLHRNIRLVLQLYGGEVTNASGAVVAYAGLAVDGEEMNLDMPVNEIEFKKDAPTPVTILLYKNLRKSGDKFEKGDELPADWAVGENKNLECKMWLGDVANE
jgi:hypothetical protein